MRYIGTYLLMSLLMNQLTSADIIYVPEEHGTIQEAMDNASVGDIIDLGPGNWTNQRVWGLSGVTLRGRQGAEATIIDGSQHDWSPVFCYGAPSIIEGITFRNGVGSDIFGVIRGGAIYAEFVQVTITDCVFEANHVELGEFGTMAVGGAICSWYAPMTIDRCLFTNNSSHGQGGAIYITSDPSFDFPLIVRDCEFTDNSADETGGGIAGDQTEMMIKRCEFRQNYAGWLGGGIYSAMFEDATSGLTSLIQECRFHRNYASMDGFGMGGGIAIDNAQEIDVVNCSFEDNYGYIAGAICGGDPGINAIVRTSNTFFCGNSLNDNWGQVVDDGTSIYEVMCTCSVDVDNDGTVATDDVLLVISNWGVFAPDADINNDGSVNVQDLLLVIGAWGPCA